MWSGKNHSKNKKKFFMPKKNGCLYVWSINLDQKKISIPPHLGILKL
jgi:hypothetical protein